MLPRCALGTPQAWCSVLIQACWHMWTSASLASAHDGHQNKAWPTCFASAAGQLLQQLLKDCGQCQTYRTAAAVRADQSSLARLQLRLLAHAVSQSPLQTLREVGTALQPAASQAVQLGWLSEAQGSTGRPLQAKSAWQLRCLSGLALSLPELTAQLRICPASGC